MDQLDSARIDVPGLEVRVVERCTSTNSLLSVEKSNSQILLAAEEQTAGRGRHGRRWRSARGAGATFSIRRSMRCTQRELAGLSVAVGIAAARALRRLGARGVRVKWPNDLMINKRKLAGILIETKPAKSGSTVVVGIGINCRAQPRLGARLGRGVAALEEVLRRPVSRNAVIEAVAREVLGALSAWEQAWERAGEHVQENLRRQAA